MSEVTKPNVPDPDENFDEEPKNGPNSIVAKNAGTVAKEVRMARFRGRPMVMVYDPYPHFVPLHKEQFDRIGYPILGGVSRSRMGDVFAYLGNTAEDLSEYDRYVLFGVDLSEMEIEADTDIEHMVKNKPIIWDMKELANIQHVPPSQAIWRSPYAKMTQAEGGDVCDDKGRLKFVMQLAGGDEGLYDDIMQSLAPLVMERKPDGVIWWVGDGANGKSTLMDAVYKVFPGQLSSLTVKRLVDGRDTPSLNGTLGNIVKESSEGRVEDTEIYKALGTHEDFRVHKFHSQDDILIRGNLHHVFSANQIPTFNDKGYSARRRTFIIPFKERFDSDPSFEDRTFTPEFFGRLIQQMCVYAVRLREQGYRYKWSAVTLDAKLEYDAAASNAEEYARTVIEDGVVAFESFEPLKRDYENWCMEEGYVPLGITNLRRAMSSLGFERLSYRTEAEKTEKHYRLPQFKPGELQSFSMARPGLYTVPGFKQRTETPDVPDFNEVKSDEKPKPKKNGVVGDKW